MPWLPQSAVAAPSRRCTRTVRKFQVVRHLGLASPALRRDVLPARLLQKRSIVADFTLAFAVGLSEPTEHSQRRYLRNKLNTIGSGRELDIYELLLTLELILKVGSVLFAGIGNLGNLVRMFGLPLRPAVGLR